MRGVAKALVNWRMTYSIYKKMRYCCCFLLLACAEKESSIGPDTARDVVSVQLRDIVANDSGALQAVLQTPAGTSFVLPLQLCPASALDLLLEGVDFPRPLTHNLLLAAADSLGMAIGRVELSLGVEGAVEARVVFAGNSEVVLHAAPGDAIALHYASGASLVASVELVEHFAGPAAKIAVPVMPSLPLLRRARRAQADAIAVEMHVLGMVESGADLAVVLLDPTERRAFPLLIGFCQASAILATLQNEESPAVHSHQLLVEFLRASRASVEYARITERRGDTYIGALALQHGHRSFVLDARPSDALALALRTGAPVQLAMLLLDELGEDAEPYRALFAERASRLVSR